MQSSICAGNRPDQKLQHLWSNKNIKKGQDSLIPYPSSAHAKVIKVQMLGLPLVLTRAWEGRRGVKVQGGSSFTAGRHGSSSQERAYKAFNSGLPT